MKRHAYTLIELIIVIVVALIVISMTVATYQKIVTGKQVDAGVAAVGANLMRARQLAIAERRQTALLLPGPNVGIADAKRYSAFRVAYVYWDESKSAYIWDTWPEDSKWEFTGAGAAIMEADQDVGIYSGGWQKIPIDDSFEVVDDVDLEGLGGTTGVNDVRAIIFSKTGKLSHAATYVTVGEAVFTGGTWIIKRRAATSTNDSSSNQITIEVNRFTGSIRYISPDNY